MFGAIASALGGAGLSIAQDFLQSTGPLAKAQLKQQGRVTGQNLEYQKAYDKFKSNLDYMMAEQYARNSAGWNVAGLKAANLNPILAATDGNFRGTFGSPSSGSISTGSVSASRRDATTAATLAASTARNNALVEAQIKQAEAQTRNIEQDTINKAKTLGLGGTAGGAAAVVNGVLNHAAEIPARVVNSAEQLGKGAVRVFAGEEGAKRLSAWKSRMMSGLDHDAKSAKHIFDFIRRRLHRSPFENVGVLTSF